MTADTGSMEGLLSGAGVALAAALIMIVVLSLFQSLGPADAYIALQSAAAGVSGDIATVAASAVPGCNCETCPADGVTIRITSDYVVAADPFGRTFAKPLAVRVYPGNYSGSGDASWADTGGLLGYLNRTFGRTGGGQSPLSHDNNSKAAALLETARLSMASEPLAVDPGLPLKVEKLFLHAFDNDTGKVVIRPYVFVYQ